MEAVIIRLPAKVKREFSSLCEQRGLSLSAYLRMLVADELERKK